MDNETQALQQPHWNGAGDYLIVVSGLLGDHWEPELQLQLVHGQTALGATTTLRGQLPDQCALLGVLNRLAMWGYLILEVRYKAGQDAEGAPLGEELSH